jgi:hypothetical protein
MRVTFGGLEKTSQFAGTVQRGAQSETFDVEKLGLRPFWDLSVTVGGGDQNVWRYIGQPQVYRAQHVTASAGTDRAYIDGLDEFQIRADGFWNGRRARVYTVANGVRSLLADTTVTATKVDLRGFATGSNQMTTGTSYEWPVLTSYRPSVGYWFRVAAINGSGGIGTYSSWVQYTAPSSIGTTTASPSLTPITHTGSSGLSAPTGVGVAAKGGDTATAVISWDAVGGASGYVIQYSFQDPTLNVDDAYIDLDASGLAIPAGAVVILDWTAAEQTDKWSSRYWAASESRIFGIGAPTVTNQSWVAYSGGDPAPAGVYGLYYSRRVF